MKLIRSGTGLRSVPTGLAIQPPEAPEARETLERAYEDAGATRDDEGWHLQVPQVARDGELIDSVDRVQVAAGSLRDLIAAGL